MRKLLLILAFVGIGAMMFSAALLFYFQRLGSETGPPVTFHSTKFEKEMAKGGEIVSLRVERTAHYHCEGALVRGYWELAEKGRATYEYTGSRLTLGVGETGLRVFDLPIEIPYLDPGVWFYSPQLTYFCKSGDRSVRQTKSRLEILP